MIFCIASDCKVKEVKTLPECDIAVFGFKGLGEVDYESELKGLTDKFEDAAFPKRLSAGFSAAVKPTAEGCSENRCRSRTGVNFWGFRI